MAGLVLENLRKHFGTVVALKGLDLEVDSGAFVSFLGPSGCGKTTALRIIAGFEQADSGRILVDGKDVRSTPANRRDMGMVFQAYSLFPNMSALDNVAFGLKLRRRPAAERKRRAGELLEMVGLASAADRYPHQLSGGQQQRVALARALAIEPSVLLLDEPLSALDAKVRVQLREEIRRIQTRLGITTIYVTHDQEEALSVSDQVVVLSQGQIEQVGPPVEIYGHPKTLFVAEFIGTMNRIRGVVRAGGAVEAAGVSFYADVARGVLPGSEVVLLLRPESIEVRPLETGSVAPQGLEGTVGARTFLGSITRLAISTPGGDLKADVPSAHVAGIPDGTPVVLGWDPATPRLIELGSSPSLVDPSAVASARAG